MLGLADQYTDVEFTSKNTFQMGVRYSMNYKSIADNELMGMTSVNSTKSEVTERDINAIAKYALNRYAAGKHFNGKVLLDSRRLAEDYPRDKSLAAPSIDDTSHTSFTLPQDRELVSPHEESKK